MYFIILKKNRFDNEDNQNFPNHYGFRYEKKKERKLLILKLKHF